MTEIEDKLREILKNRLAVEPQAVQTDSRLSDHGDSLDFVDVLGDVEALFDLHFTNEQIATIRTFGDLVRAVRGEALVAR